MPPAPAGRTMVVHMRVRPTLLAVAVLAVAASPAAATTYGGGALAFPDTFSEPALANPYPSVITVTGGGVVQDVDVRLPGLTHDYPEELDILLVGPNGRKVMLLSDAASWTSFVNMDLTLDDEAGVTVPDEPVNKMSYRPTDNPGDDDSFPAPAPDGDIGTSLAVFDNMLVEGDWRLFVTDDTGYSGGALSTWVVRTEERMRLRLRFQGATAPGESGTYGVIITRDPGGLPAQVDYATTGPGNPYYGLATPGEEFVPTSGTLTFAAGETQQRFDIQLLDDTVDEMQETIPFTLTNARGDALVGVDGTASYSIWLADDDAPPPYVPPPRPAALGRPMLSGATTQRLVRQKFKVKLTGRTTVDGALAARGEITVPKRSNKVQLKAVRVPVKANVRTRLALAVKKADVATVRRALKRYKKLRAVVYVRAEDGTGRTSSISRLSVTLKP